MSAPDTSVLVAAFATWHESHAIANERLGHRTRVIAHTAYEVVSTLTRLPEPFRVSAEPAAAFLARRTSGPWLALDGDTAHDGLQTAVAAGIRGGALYDALVGLTAKANDAVLLTLDRRAAPTYRALDVSYELLT